MVVYAKSNSGYAIMHRRSYPMPLGVSKELLKGAFRVAKDAFSPSITEQEAESYFAPNNLLLIAVSKNDGMMVGFATSIYNGQRCCLYSAFIAREHQRQGIYNVFNRVRINDGLKKGFDTFKVTTQNPKVERGILTVLTNFVEEGKITGYSIRREIKPGKYGKMLTEEIPVSRDWGTNSVYKYLDHSRGDAFELRFTIECNRPFI